jgi:hypothetical protein
MVGMDIEKGRKTIVKLVHSPVGVGHRYMQRERI